MCAGSHGKSARERRKRGPGSGDVGKAVVVPWMPVYGVESSVMTVQRHADGKVMGLNSHGIGAWFLFFRYDDDAMNDTGPRPPVEHEPSELVSTQGVSYGA